MDNPGFILESGMFARVSIPEEKHTDVLLVPTAAVLEREGKKLIFLAREGKAESRLVHTGLSTYEFTEVTDGDIKPGDPVIVDGFYAVRDGSPIDSEK